MSLALATVITVSDRCAAGTATDESGPVIATALLDVADGVDTVLVPDGVDPVRHAIRAAITQGSLVIVTTGGTGIGPRDLTPEATAPLIATPLPGIAEALRAADATVPGAALSRGLAGLTSGGVLVINVPGSLGAATTAARVLPPLVAHALEQLRGDDHGPVADDDVPPAIADPLPSIGSALGTGSGAVAGVGEFLP